MSGGTGTEGSAVDDRAERSLELTFRWDGETLVGSLRLPRGAGPHPAVIMAQGSGPADRGSGRFFGPIADTFVDQGVATFAFDKPGCGRSSGDWRQYGLSGRADQLVVAIDLIRDHPEIDGQRVGLWGHSQGGWLTQMLAGRPVDLAFAVANSAPTIGVPEQILYDARQTMGGDGFDEDETEEALDLVRALRQAAMDGTDFESMVAELLEPSRDRSWFASFPPIDDAGDWTHLSLLVSDPYEPVSALAGVECPFLAVYGALDPLLPPWQGMEESGRALGEAPTTDATVVVFPNGNHRIQVPGTETFVDGYLDLLGRWVSDRVGRHGGR